MPLHLLGKKSWNVYNHVNVERVKRDEAEAAAREAAQEQRMQEIDAERRIRLLRGLPVEDLIDQPEKAHSTAHSQPTYSERDRKKHRRHGEDDTDRDIRYAKEAQSQDSDTQSTRQRKRARDEPLHDSHGHINLFPEPRVHRAQNSAIGNPEAELEKARKERELEDQYTLRFSNAAGFKQAVDRKPWYHGKSIANDSDQQISSLNVWGDEDPRRRQREQIRMASDDPLAAIHNGVKGVRQAEKDRREWKDKQQRDIDEMIKEERYAAKRAARDDLEGFSLDNDDSVERESKHGRHRKHRHEHRHRKEARNRSRSPHRRRRHGRERSGER